jgi:Spy/CpxP family protein refolding chaperone
MMVFAVVLVTLAALAPAAPALAFHEEAGRAVGDVVDHLRGLGTRLEHELFGLGSRLEREVLGPVARGPEGSSAAERPLITFMLDRRQELALTPEQVTRLEALRQAFTREAIRRDADIRVAELDLAAILDHDPVDVARAEAKILELAQLRAQLRVERLKTIEQGKAVLTPEQRARLQTLLGKPAGSARRPADGRTRL